jgi:hypothetical protein
MNTNEYKYKENPFSFEPLTFRLIMMNANSAFKIRIRDEHMFKMNSMSSATFTGKVEALESLFPSNLSEDFKCNYLHQILCQDTLRLLRSIKDNDELDYVEHHSTMGDPHVLASEFSTPTKKSKYLLRVDRPPYVPLSFDETVDLLRDSMSGDADAGDAKQAVKALFLSDPSKAVHHILKFNDLLAQYNVISNNSGDDASNVRWFLKTIPDAITNHVDFSQNLSCAQKNVQKTIKLLKQRGSLKSKYSKITPSRTGSVLHIAPRSVNFGEAPVRSLQFQCSPGADATVHSIVSTFNSALEADDGCLLEAAASAMGKELRPGAVDTMKPSTYSSIHTGLQAGMSRASSGTEAIASISHMLPRTYLKKVTRTTETTHGYDDLNTKSEDELKTYFKKSQLVGRFKHKKRLGAENDDSDSESESDHTPSAAPTQRKSKRRQIAALSQQLIDMKSVMDGIVNKSQDSPPVWPEQSFPKGEYRTPADDLGRTAINALSEVVKSFSTDQLYGQGISAFGQRPDHRASDGYRGGQRDHRSAYDSRNPRSASPHTREQPRHEPRREDARRTQHPLMTCDKCQGAHYTGRCPQLFDERGQRNDVLFCNYCKKCTHMIKDCPVLATKHCSACGKTGHNPSHCPEATCSKCQRKGHISTYCKAEGASKNGRGEAHRAPR